MNNTPVSDAVNSYLEKKAPVLFFMLDLEGKILSANEYATRFIGRPLTGVRFNDVIVDFSSAFDLLTAVKGPPEEQMITVCDGSGTPETFYFTFKQIKDKVLAFGRMDADELDTMRKEVLDLNREQNNLVRELHKTNARLTQKKKDLAQSLGDLKAAQAKLIESEKMASLGRLVAGFAHEVNTPVGIALTASSSILESSDQIDRMLMQDEVEEDDLISALETIRDASKLVFSNLNRSADLVGSFKRTSIDQSFDNLSVYCLNDTIDDVLTTMGIKIKKASVKAVLNSRETINLYGNPGDIFQVISNLFENSLLHGFENGRLKGKILIDIRKKGKEVLIRYSDTGKGMSGETLGRIFEPFYTTLRARGGTGLGMYICHNIVTARLNGTIECSSKQGEGTRFLITIPITRVKKHETDPV